MALGATSSLFLTPGTATPAPPWAPYSNALIPYFLQKETLPSVSTIDLVPFI